MIREKKVNYDFGTVMNIIIRPLCDNFVIMWNILFLFIIHFEFNYSSASELIEIPGGIPVNPIHGRSSKMQENKTAAVPNAEKELVERRLRNDQLTEKWLNSSNNVNFDLTRISNTKSIKNSRLIEQKSPYNEPSQSYSDQYDTNDGGSQVPPPRKRRPLQHYEYPPDRSVNLLASPKKEGSASSNRQFKNDLSGDINHVSANSKLKTLLKMQPSKEFSLSEILQQQNLSLNDLLKGKIKIISTLKLPHDVNNKMEEYSGNNNPLAALARTSQVLLHTNENTLMTRFLDVKKTGAFVHDVNNDDNDHNNDTAHSETMISTENVILPELDLLKDMPTIVATTPRHMEMGLVSTIRETTLAGEEIIEFSDFLKNGSREPVIMMDDGNENITPDIGDDLRSTVPIALAVLKTADKWKIISKKDEPSIYDSINLDYQNEEPPNVSDFTNMRDNNSMENLPGNSSLLNHRTFVRDNKIYEGMISKIEPEARAEILELINNPSTAEKLRNLLEARNMSLDELVALRQRGSSSIHLSQVNSFHAQSHSIRLNKDQFVLLNFSNTHNTNIADMHFKNADGKKIIDVSIERLHQKKKNEKNNQDSLQLIDFFSAIESLPSAIRTNSTVSNSPSVLRHSVTEIHKFEEGTFNFNRTLLELLNVGEINQNHELSLRKNFIRNPIETSDDHTPNTFLKLQSSIIASCTILAITIISFLSIFIGLRMRRKKKLIYTNPFQRRTFQVPTVNTKKLSISNESNKIMINAIATSPIKNNNEGNIKEANNEIYHLKSDIENDSLDTNDSWDTIPDFMK